MFDMHVSMIEECGLTEGHRPSLSQLVTCIPAYYTLLTLLVHTHNMYCTRGNSKFQDTTGVITYIYYVLYEG